MRPRATRSATPQRELRELRARLAVGAGTADVGVLPPRVRRAVELARELGAPTEPAVAAAVAGVDADRDRERAVRVATAQARAVVAGLGALPVVAVPGLGALLDRSLVGFYLTPAGRVVAVVSATLILAGLVLARHLIRTVLRPPRDAPDDEVHDLVATALTAGLPPGEAVRAAAATLDDAAGRHLRSLALALELGQPTVDRGPTAALAEVLTSAARWGAPAAPALRRTAHDLRADARARVDAAAQRLPALLAFPTVVLLLPACLLLVGAPVLASGLEVVASGA